MMLDLDHMRLTLKAQEAESPRDAATTELLRIVEAAEAYALDTANGRMPGLTVGEINYRWKCWRKRNCGCWK